MRNVLAFGVGPAHSLLMATKQNLVGKTVEMLDADRKTVIGRAVVRAAVDFGMGAAVEIEWRAGYVETTTAAGVRAAIRRGHLRVAS